MPVESTYSKRLASQRRQWRKREVEITAETAKPLNCGDAA
jgi:hypothetical protein